MYLSYLFCVSKFGLPPSASCPFNRNFNDDECLPLVSVTNGCASGFFLGGGGWVFFFWGGGVVCFAFVFLSLESRSHPQNSSRRVYLTTEIFCLVRSEPPQ